MRICTLTVLLPPDSGVTKEGMQEEIEGNRFRLCTGQSAYTPVVKTLDFIKKHIGDDFCSWARRVWRPIDRLVKQTVWSDSMGPVESFASKPVLTLTRTDSMASLGKRARCVIKTHLLKVTARWLIESFFLARTVLRKFFLMRVSLARTSLSARLPSNFWLRSLNFEVQNLTFKINAILTKLESRTMPFRMIQTI